MAASRCITSSLREVDLIGRIGGDEFVVLLPSANADQVTVVLKRLHENLKTLLHSFSPRISASIGGIFVPAGAATTVTEAIKKADEVMYSVKHATKDGVAVALLPYIGHTVAREAHAKRK